MPVKDRIKEVWGDKVIGCFGTPEQDENPDAPSSAMYPGRCTHVLESRMWYLIIIMALVFNPVAAETPFRKPMGRDWRLTRFLAPQAPPATAAAPTGTYQRSQGSQIPNPEVGVKNDVNAEYRPNRDPGDVQDANGTWIVRNVGTFSNKAVYTFSGDTLPDGLYASDYTVQNRLGDDGPRTGTLYNHRFDPANVQLSNGFVRLIVPSGQRPNRRPDKAISCAEIATTESNIISASVRTRAVFSKVPGTCHGMFFYKNDTQEIDIEYLTDPTSLSNNGPREPIPIWYTNQPIDPENPEDHDSTSETGPAPFDCTSRVHEYRIDWTPEYTAFYLDGIEQKRFTDNVPTTPGSWVWNNWANGDKGWSKGPPKGTADNVFKIQSIWMYYNTSTETT
ncbi:hypothetical protein PV10_01455 [Exophiala mesophila]|uniref:GH16 domain-containing protein n=1 Tax=Exophiala mesophila TaxID=212818 RepID=A0A0D1X7B4_EXOME|nr:uncharacterized protein PV10_01455 [Exophiala mesophila]KIV97745.1 hypothetical protein PV10_01455 [Exophiala mesophila]